MNRETHQELVRRINTQLDPSFPRVSLENGAAYPDLTDYSEKQEMLSDLPIEAAEVYTGEKRERRWESHHEPEQPDAVLKRKLLELVRKARTHWKAREKALAAFYFGVFTHLAADLVVPHKMENDVSFAVPPKVPKPHYCTITTAKNAVDKLISIRNALRKTDVNRKEYTKELYKNILIVAYTVTDWSTTGKRIEMRTSHKKHPRSRKSAREKVTNNSSHETHPSHASKAEQDSYEASVCATFACSTVLLILIGLILLLRLVLGAETFVVFITIMMSIAFLGALLVLSWIRRQW
ncbi:MAG: zinc dependent phospholipase C family protein [Candidatus Brocadiia bacterium]